MLLEPALPDEEVLYQVDLAPLLLLPPVHLVERPPGVGAAGRQLAQRDLHVANQPVGGGRRHRVHNQLFQAAAVFDLTESSEAVHDALDGHGLKVPDINVDSVNVFI